MPAPSLKKLSDTSQIRMQSAIALLEAQMAQAEYLVNQELTDGWSAEEKQLYKGALLQALATNHLAVVQTMK